MTAQSSVNIAPGPKGNFLLGNILGIRGREVTEVMHADWQIYGDIVRYRLGPADVYIVSSPELAEDVLVFQKNAIGKLYRDGKAVGLKLALGDGLLTNGVHESWLVQRRMMQPMFHRRSIATMTDKMVAAGERMLARWDEQFTPDQSVNVFEEMMHVTLDIVNRTMFSADVTANVDQVGPAVTTAAHFTFNHQRSVIKLPLSWPLRRNQEFKSAMDTLDTLVYGLIQQRRSSGERHDDLLDMLLEARDEDTGEGMNDQQLRDEVITIFAAGHETTANALTWTWYLLTQHPDVLGKLQSEVDTVLAGRTPTMDDLANLPYTEAVLKESLRLYPPAPLVPRMVYEEGTQLAGYDLPLRSRVVLSVYNIHRHPDHWDDPDTFKPERFLDNNLDGQHKLAFMPFGGGPRLCIGNHFALMEGHLLLAMMAQCYTMQLIPGHSVEPHTAVTMRPKYGMMAQLERRLKQ